MIYKKVLSNYEPDNLFNTVAKSNKSLSESFFISATIFLNRLGFLISGSKNSTGVMSKYAHISKNAFIEGKLRPEVMD